MAKILFLQEIVFEFMSCIYLSAVLKQKGHGFHLMIPSEEGKDWLLKVIRQKPDMILFSAMTGPHKWALKKAKEIKKKMKVLTVIGGIHPTLFPSVINDPSVDIICIGEGEKAILELANRLDNGEDIKTINNLWVKLGENRIHKNPILPLEDIDSLPFPDRSIYDKYPLIRDLPVKRILAGRGCPYPCTYCFNHSIKKIYPDSKNYVRHRDQRSIIDEIKDLRKKYNVKSIRFPDDILTINKKWLLKLMGLYNEEVNLPFTCLVRANEVDDEVVSSMKKAGCRNVFFGVESGNEYLRNNVLKRGMSDSQMIDAGRLFHRYKISFGTFNMFGLPSETVENALETIHLNRKINPDYPFSTVYQPYPGTELADYAISNNYMDNLDVEKFDLMSNTKLIKSKDMNQLININKLFYFFVKYPKLEKYLLYLTSLKPNRIYDFIYDATLAKCMIPAYGLNLLDGIKMSIKLKGKL